MLLSDKLENDGSVKISSQSSEKKLLRLYDNLKVLVEVSKKKDIM